MDHSGLQNVSAKEEQWKLDAHRGAARGMQVRDDGSEGAGMQREGFKSYLRR